MMRQWIRTAARLTEENPTYSPGFLAWFGQSKVVDEHGQPLVVYHGTNETFGVFAAGEFGFHFGDKDAAEMMGDVKAFYLSMQNPLLMPDVGVWSPSKVLNVIHVRARIPTPEIAKVSDAIAKLQRRLRPALDQDEDMFKQRQAHYAWSRPVRELLKRHGYDGFKYRNEAEGYGVSWIAFDPEQIRSVEPL